jgi:hypothetical protein
MPESTVEEIRIKLETHLNEIEAEIESLRSALSSMDAEAAAAAAARSEAPAAEPTRPSRRRAATNGTRRNGKPTNGARSNGKPANGAARVRRSPKASAELERLLAETGGMTAVELARETGTDYGDVLERIRELERAAGR